MFFLVTLEWKILDLSSKGQRMQPKGCDQWVCVRVEAGHRRCPSGLSWDWCSSTSLSITQIVASSAPSASLWMTPNRGAVDYVGRKGSYPEGPGQAGEVGP